MSKKAATREPSRDAIETLRRIAARWSAIPHEAEEILQDVLLAAVERDRDCSSPSFVPWASGAIRNRARFLARTMARRRRREHAYAVDDGRSSPALPKFSPTFIATLPRSRRVVALLVNLGMGRREIAHLLGLSDVAMRQRVAGVRKAFTPAAGEADSRVPFRADGLARRALKAALPNCGTRRFAVRDPDGTPIFFSATDHVPAADGNKS